MNDTTPIPKDLYTSIRDLKSNYSIIVGQLDPTEEEWQCKIKIGNSHLKPYMTTQPYLDEADLQIVLHVYESILSGCSTIVVLTNDTDVIISLLYCIPVFFSDDLKELLVKVSKGTSTRYVMIHNIFQKLGKELSSALPALNSLTGFDITSKIGTNK